MIVVATALVAILMLLVLFVRRTAMRIAALSVQVKELSDRIDMEREADRQRASAALEKFSAQMADLTDAVNLSLRKPSGIRLIDRDFLEQQNQDELIAVAESLAVLRPLVPYPGWHFDSEWSNSDLAFQLRQQLWQAFHDRKCETPVTISWHDRTRLNSYLGNDLSRQIYIGGCFEPNEFAFLHRYLQPGMTFLDAGANEGAYTVFAAKRVGGQGIVWAFEPSFRELERLRLNLDLNGLNVSVFQTALADFSGETEIDIAGYEHEGQNTLGSFVSELIESAGKQSIRVARLDGLVEANPPPRIDVMKVDVEGAELRFFKGAAATLKRYRPVVLFEVSDNALRAQGSDQGSLLGYLRSQDYDIYHFDRHTGLPTFAAPGVFGDNMIAVPAGVSLPAAVFKFWD